MPEPEPEPSDATLFAALGFSWDRAAVPRNVPMRSIPRACFPLHKELAQFVWEAGVFEGNPITFPEVQTLLGGITVGGRRVSDHRQVLNLLAGHRALLTLVKAGRFALSEDVFAELNGLLTGRDVSVPKGGVFRGEGWQAAGSRTREALRAGMAALEGCPPLERALAFFLFAALQMFLREANERTALLMMNGVLMSSGIDPLRVPATRAREYGEKMASFHWRQNASEMLNFLVDCHPDAPLMRETGRQHQDEQRKTPARSPAGPTCPPAETQ